MTKNDKKKLLIVLNRTKVYDNATAGTLHIREEKQKKIKLDTIYSVEETLNLEKSFYSMPTLEDVPREKKIYKKTCIQGGKLYTLLPKPFGGFYNRTQEARWYDRSPSYFRKHFEKNGFYRVHKYNTKETKLYFDNGEDFHDDILIHTGNTEHNTDGCPLVGEGFTVKKIKNKDSYLYYVTKSVVGYIGFVKKLLELEKVDYNINNICLYVRDKEIKG